MKLHEVLLIDDDKPTNFLNQIVIQRSECVETIVCKQDASSGLEYIKDLQTKGGTMPGLVLLDINMPGMSGWDFLDEYDKLPKGIREHTKIIMTTTSLNPDDEQRANRNQHITGYCKKPLTAAKWEGLMQTYFDL